MSLEEWIPAVTQGYVAPKHLQPLLTLFQRIEEGEPVRAVLHAPPRHAKTDTILHGIAWLLEKDQRWKSGYFTYADELSTDKGRFARSIAQAAGIDLEKSLEGHWSTALGGGLISGGVGGVFTGFGVNLLVVDDAFKNRLEADSGLIRERRWEWFRDVARTRIEPGGSILVCGTRWHPDDLQGRLIKQGWEYIRLPALSDEEKPLWPERWTAKELNEIRRDIGEYGWVSLYQGEPRPKGGTVFQDPSVFTVPHKHGIRYAIGLDLAYSESTHADYSCAVLVAESSGVYQIVRVIRKQCKATEFKRLVVKLCEDFPTARVGFKGSGTEKGTVDFFKTPQGDDPGVNMEWEQARGDKFQRAQPVAAAWNAKKVQVPNDAPWLNDFLSEVADFTGIEDKHDDQVDALGAAYDMIARPMPTHQGGWGEAKTPTRRM